MTDASFAQAHATPTGHTSPGAPTAEVAALAPPEPTALVQPESLIAPAPVEAVSTTQVGGMVPLTAERAGKIAAMADSYTGSVLAADPRAPGFGSKIRDLETMGAKEMRASADVSARLLDRPVKALAATSRAGQRTAAAGDAVTSVTRDLDDLTELVNDLDPATTSRSLLDRIAGRDDAQAYLKRYTSAQERLDAVLGGLMRGADLLRKDNAALEGEKVDLWNAMTALNEYAQLAGTIDARLSAAIPTIAATDPGRADALTKDVLYAVRSRHQDLLLQLAVAAQGYLAMDVVRRNNTELIRGVERATRTTLAALRTAIVTAQAIAGQRLVLDKVKALDSVAAQGLEKVSAAVSTTMPSQAEVTDAHAALAALEGSFREVRASLDAVASYRDAASASLAATVGSLEHELAATRKEL